MFEDLAQRRFESRFLFVGTQRLAGQQTPFDALRRVTAAAAVTEGDLPDPLLARGELLRIQ